MDRSDKRHRHRHLTPGSVLTKRTRKFASRWLQICNIRSALALYWYNVADPGLDTTRRIPIRIIVSCSFSFWTFRASIQPRKESRGGVLVGPHAFSSPHAFPTAPPLIRYLLLHAVISLGCPSATWSLSAVILNDCDVTYRVSIWLWSIVDGPSFLESPSYITKLQIECISIPHDNFNLNRKCYVWETHSHPQLALCIWLS